MRPFAILSLLILLALSTFLLLRAAKIDSLTYDERLHLDSALEWWSIGQSPSDPFNPPLSKLPGYLLSRLKVNLEADPFALLPRLTTILLSQLLLVTVFIYSYTQFQSNSISLISVIILGLEPLFLAHGHLFTTDLMATLTYFLAVTSWSKLSPDHTPGVLAFSLCLGLLAATKLTLLPALILYIFLDCILHKSQIFNPKLIILISLCSLFTIYAIFGFRPAPVLDRTPPIPLGGFLNTTLHSISAALNPKFISTRKFIYFGQVRGTGWFSYPLVSFFLKTSPLLLFTLILGLKSSLRSNFIRNTQLLIPAVTVLLVLTLGRYSTGARHLLPMYPFLALFTARTLISFPLKIKLVSLLLIIFSYTPNPLAYFNPIIGSRLGGQIIADSNLDWGQNLYRLSQNINRNPSTSPLYCSLFSPLPASTYGLSCLPLITASELTPAWTSGKTLLISRTSWYTQGYARTFLNQLKPEYLSDSTHLLFRL